MVHATILSKGGSPLRWVDWNALSLVGAALMALIAQVLGLLGFRIDLPENLSSDESIFVLRFLQAA